MSVLKHIDFGMKDDRGRKIGALVNVWGSPHEGVDCREVLVRATRNGCAFGAIPRSRVVPTAKVEAEVKRRVTGMVKRYAKQANLLAEGCYAKWVDQTTGVVLTLRDAEDYENDPTAGRYFVVCEEHSTCVGVGSKAAGRSCSGIDFCDDCREANP